MAVGFFVQIIFLFLDFRWPRKSTLLCSRRKWLCATMLSQVESRIYFKFAWRKWRKYSYFSTRSAGKGSEWASNVLSEKSNFDWCWQFYKFSNELFIRFLRRLSMSHFNFLINCYHISWNRLVHKISRIWYLPQLFKYRNICLQSGALAT